MTAFYPSQVGYPASHSIAPGMPMTHSYGVPASYAAPVGGVMYVPSHPSYHNRRRRHRHSYPSYPYGHRQPPVMSAVPVVGAPVMMVCSLIVSDFSIVKWSVATVIWHWWWFRLQPIFMGQSHTTILWVSSQRQRSL